MSAPLPPDDLSGIRRRLADSRGRVFWKSLEELSGSARFKEFLEREFPEQASEWDDPEGRRDFLRVMGASLALAGLTGCTRQPEEKIVPYVRAPEDELPGRPLFFATAVVDDGYARGVLVESHMGRPTKVEGNPDHPLSLGATDAFAQAAILQLYDPDRSQTLTYRGEIRPWGNFLAAMHSAVAAQRAAGGAGVRLLTGTVTSPTLIGQVQEFLATLPGARWHQWEPAGPHQTSGLQHRIEAADLLLSLDADFVGAGPARVRDARAYTSRRKLQPGGPAMNRLYVVESAPSLTGALADHRLAVRPSEVDRIARAIVGALDGGVASAEPGHQAWIAALATDLQRHAGRSLVLAGEWQPPAVHALARDLNQRLGNVGRTVTYSAVPPAGDAFGSLRELAADMDAGRVSLLVVSGTNPVYTAPVDLEFSARMDKVGLRVHLGLYQDETAERCHWHVPEAHTFESWGDARAADGTVTILQPLIAPLYGGKTAHELLAALTDRPERTAYEIVREHWQTGGGLGGDFERAWQQALHDGVVRAPAAEGTATLPAAPTASTTPAAAPFAAAPVAAAETQGLELAFRPDPSVYDGRFANVGWLQELPKPLTKLTWDNAALMSPRTAARLGITTEATSRGTTTDLVLLRYRGRAVTAPALAVPGHPDETVTVHLGYGRARAGRVGSGLGFNAYALRTSDAPWSGAGLEVAKTGERYTLAVTQEHWSLEGRNIVRAATRAQHERDPHFAARLGHKPGRELTMYPEHKYEGYAWGMAIDLNSCVGCNACVVACQAENNIPVVGKDQVARGREMHWLRVDQYYTGAVEDPDTYFAPVPCMHCEMAPCEVVCPVAATVHSEEGLNDMVYNRCVGTRYCSNNCPYKVRRFNFFLYSDWETPSLKLGRNPDVTVRSRGVMEKCTYCVQRINHARVQAKNEDRKVRDGEIQTACAQACPGRAIVFGDINDPRSEVARLKADPRNYGMLEELNTRPRTTYLAAVRNPNPEMPDQPALAPGTASHG
ncbi:MAG TPA: TAT-variant-translocated molybdopterin oxidoreductase [Vicinamibacteria bacterium]|nr:TAT-variant-translocated molybdopterin oxidoreductase [Vicinamibacteria bacterium]